MARTNTHSAFIASALGAGVAEIATLPICTVKTNFQNHHLSIINTIKKIYHKSGIKGFYSASYPAIGGQIISSASKYTLYNGLTEFIPNVFLAGAISGFLSSLITHPIDVIKIYQQMNTPFYLDLRKEGPKLFYRGYSKTFIKATIGSSLFFPLFDTLKDYTLYIPKFAHGKFCQRNEVSLPLAALGSALISTSIMQPIDYMKTRQVYGNSIKLGFNPINYYRGYGLNLTRIVPHFVIMMLTLEAVKAQLN